MLPASELAAWLRLLITPGVGRESARRLLSAFGSAEAVFRAPRPQLDAVAGPLSPALAAAPEELAALHEATQRWLDQAHGRSVLTLGDPAYPPLLLETPDPPLMLFAHGRIDLLKATSIAVVGSRKPSPQGKDNARAFAAHFSRSGHCVVSGLAAGIDGRAHEGALEGAGSTVAVVGTGLDRVYPRQHHALAKRIAEQGLLISEFPLGTPPLPGHFPQRNRIIAGLSRGTLVVEAALQSGSLITARLAADMGRDVFAVPGSIHSPQSRGCHALIKQGAKLVESAEDVLEELNLLSSMAAPPAPATEAPEPADDVLAALGHDPTTVDALIARTGIPPQSLSARLLELELDGLVVRLPGGLFQRRAAA